MTYHQFFRAYMGDVVPHCGLLYTWNAKDDAIYFSKNGKPEELMYHWVKD